MLWYESLILPDQGQRASATAAEMSFKTFEAKVFAYIEVLEAADLKSCCPMEAEACPPFSPVQPAIQHASYA